MPKSSDSPLKIPDNLPEEQALREAERLRDVLILVEGLLRQEEATVGMIVDCLYDIGSVRIIDNKLPVPALKGASKSIAGFSKPVVRLIALRWLKKNCPALLTNWLYSKVQQVSEPSKKTKKTKAKAPKAKTKTPAARQPAAESGQLKPSQPASAMAEQKPTSAIQDMPTPLALQATPKAEPKPLIPAAAAVNGATPSAPLQAMETPVAQSQPSDSEAIAPLTLSTLNPSTPGYPAPPQSFAAPPVSSIVPSTVPTASPNGQRATPNAEAEEEAPATPSDNGHLDTETSALALTPQSDGVTLGDLNGTLQRDYQRAIAQLRQRDREIQRLRTHNTLLFGVVVLSAIALGSALLVPATSGESTTANEPTATHISP